MNSPDTLEFSVLLQEFAGDSPAGVDLRVDEAHDSLIRRISDARDKSRLVERKHLETPADYSLAQCQWDLVQQLCIEALSQHSKDLSVAAWLCESLVRSEGFAGLRDAFRLIRELAEKFWDRLYPLPDGKDMTPRIRLLGGLFTGVLLLPVKRIAITPDGRCFLDLDQANRLEGISDSGERERYAAAGVKTLAELRQRVTQAPDDFYRTLLGDLNQCLEELDKLESVLVEKCGEDESGREQAPPTSDTHKLLENCRKELLSLLGDRLTAAPSDGPPLDENVAMGDAEQTTAVSSFVTSNTKQEMTRELAFRLLSDLAQYFRRLEPHSPISHHLEQAIRWGKMTLPELLEELITDDATRAQVFTRVGIERPDKSQ